MSPAPSPERFAVWGGLAYFTDSQRASALHVASHNLGAAYAIDARWAFSLEWGLSGLHSTSDAAPSETVVVVGNPTGFAWYNLDQGRTRLRVGAGATFPAASVDEEGGGRLERSAYTHANGMDGLSRLWLWAPNRTSLLLRAESIVPMAPWLTLEAALTPAVVVPAWSDFPSDSVDFMIPAQLGIVAAHHGFELGSRIQAVWMPTNALDALQLSLEPGVGYSTGTVRVGAYATVNLDEPLAGERGPGIWGLHLALEVQL